MVSKHGIGVLIKDLGPVDSAALREAVLALEESKWREETVRQKKYKEVHYNTESVILIFCDHDDWPRIDVVRRKRAEKWTAVTLH